MIDWDMSYYSVFHFVNRKTKMRRYILTICLTLGFYSPCISRASLIHFRLEFIISDYKRHAKSTLELLPDELFLELFSFIKPIDLYLSFVDLNSCLNNILHDIHIANNDYHEQYEICLNYFSSQIGSLAVDCR